MRLLGSQQFGFAGLRLPFGLRIWLSVALLPSKQHWLGFFSAESDRSLRLEPRERADEVVVVAVESNKLRVKPV